MWYYVIHESKLLKGHIDALSHNFVQCQKAVTSSAKCHMLRKLPKAIVDSTSTNVYAWKLTLQCSTMKTHVHAWYWTKAKRKNSCIQFILSVVSIIRISLGTQYIIIHITQRRNRMQKHLNWRSDAVLAFAHLSFRFFPCLSSRLGLDDFCAGLTMSTRRAHFNLRLHISWAPYFKTEHERDLPTKIEDLRYCTKWRNIDIIWAMSQKSTFAKNSRLKT